MSSRDRFAAAVSAITARIEGRALDEHLQSFLNRDFAPESDAFGHLAALCRTGIDEGWLCDREHGGIRFGRIIKPGPQTNDFSVDVVQMENIAGPYHGHPNGEIDMVIPESAQAEFDGTGRGWKVYPAGSEHYPTVTGGRAIVLYLLPLGAIDFSRTAP